MLAPMDHRDATIQRSRRMLWTLIILACLSAVVLQWYRDYQRIANFSAVGIITKLQHKSSNESLAFIEVFTRQGLLQRLADDRLVLPDSARAGDRFDKAAGTSQARIGDQYVDLQNPPD